MRLRKSVGAIDAGRLQIRLLWEQLTTTILGAAIVRKEVAPIEWVGTIYDGLTAIGYAGSGLHVTLPANFGPLWPLCFPHSETLLPCTISQRKTQLSILSMMTSTFAK